MENTFYRQQRAVFPIPMLSMFFPDAIEIIHTVSAECVFHLCRQQAVYDDGYVPVSQAPVLSEFADGVAAAYRQAGISGFCKSVDGEEGVVCR